MLASSSQCSKRLKPRLQTVRLRDQLEEEHRQMRLFGIPKYTRHQAMKKNKKKTNRRLKEFEATFFERKHENILWN